MRVIFMGTPDFATPALNEIVRLGHEIVAVYTRAPKPAGRRGLTAVPSAVHEMARRFGLPTFTPTTLRNPDVAAEFRKQNADVAVVAAYGLLLPLSILEAPRHGCINLHASLLPRWRGAAPIHRAVMAGDIRTGVTLMHMNEGLDTGPSGPVERLDIGENDTASEVHDRLANLAGSLIASALAALAKGELFFTPQSEEGVSYARKIEKSECRIDWAQPAKAIHNHIRGLSPFPGAFFEADFGRGAERVKVLESRVAEGQAAPGARLDEGLTIACGSGAVRLICVQRAGKERMSAESFLRGSHLPPGAVLL